MPGPKSGKSEPERVESTFAPVRNFTISLQDRIRAADGPPAYMRRKRAIEDLEESLLNAVRALVRKLAGTPDLEHAVLEAARLRLDVREINRLIDTHNRYYPIEANLPMHPKTGALVERGGMPWRPLAPITIEDIVARVFAES